MKTGACGPDPITTARCQGIPLVLVLVVALGRFLVEDENDFQARKAKAPGVEQDQTDMVTGRRAFE